jgi:hypothetical protein
MAKKTRPKHRSQIEEEVKQILLDITVVPSIQDGFYESGDYYASVLEWISRKLGEVESKRRSIVYLLHNSALDLEFAHKLIAFQQSLPREKVARLKQLQSSVSVPNRTVLDIVLEKEGGREVLNIAAKGFRRLGNSDVRHEVRVVMPEAVSKKENASSRTSPSRIAESEFAAKFNTPELLERRKATIARDNASHTTESDDALEGLLKDFESLTFG